MRLTYPTAFYWFDRKIRKSKYIMRKYGNLHLWQKNMEILTRVWHIPLPDCLGQVNSLAPGKFEWKFRHLIFQIISVTDVWGISCELAFRWMSLDFTDDKSTLVKVMAWSREPTSHYLSQWWPRSMSPYDVTRPQWAKNASQVSRFWQCFLLNSLQSVGTAVLYQVISSISLPYTDINYADSLIIPYPSWPACRQSPADQRPRTHPAGW